MTFDSLALVRRVVVAAMILAPLGCSSVSSMMTLTSWEERQFGQDAAPAYAIAYGTFD